MWNLRQVLDSQEWARESFRQHNQVHHTSQSHLPHRGMIATGQNVLEAEMRQVKTEILRTDRMQFTLLYRERKEKIDEDRLPASLIKSTKATLKKISLYELSLLGFAWFFKIPTNITIIFIICILPFSNLPNIRPIHFWGCPAFYEKKLQNFITLFIFLKKPFNQQIISSHTAFQQLEQLHQNAS